MKLKRQILFSTSILISSMVFGGSQYKNYDPVTIAITMSVGESMTLNPISDLGMSTSNTLGCPFSASYDVSDFSAFTVTPTAVQTTWTAYYKVDGSNTGFYHTYDIVAHKAGSYTLTGNVSYIWELYTPGDGHYYAYGRDVQATYNITVVDVTSISIPNSISLFVGDTYTFSPIILDSHATASLTWYSSNASVATIDDNGKLTTMGAGTTTISCTAPNGVSAQCEVTVNPVLVTGITLNEMDVNLAVGSRLQLEATYTPENATDKSVTWSSTNENVALVTEAGRVIAIGPGFCMIKATANDGSGKFASCFIEVTDASNVRGDMNGDGKVTITDAVKVIDIVLEKQ